MTNAASPDVYKGRNAVDPQGNKIDSVDQVYLNDQTRLEADLETQARRPGVFSPSIAPGLGQWAVISRPSSSATSAKKRL